jgi:hypothetical protein
MMFSLHGFSDIMEGRRFISSSHNRQICSVSNRTQTGDSYFLRLFGAACDKALPAAIFEAVLVRPSRNTFEAAFAAFGLVRRWAIAFSPPLVIFTSTRLC